MAEQYAEVGKRVSAALAAVRYLSLAPDSEYSQITYSYAFAACRGGVTVETGEDGKTTFHVNVETYEENDEDGDFSSAGQALSLRFAAKVVKNPSGERGLTR